MANLTNVALGLQARSLAVHQITMSLTGISSFDNIEERSWTELVAMHVSKAGCRWLTSYTKDHALK